MHKFRRMFCVWSLASAVAFATASVAQASRFAFHLDAGMGGSRTEPYITGAAVSGTIGLGVSTRLAGPVRASLEARASAGSEFPPKGFPEAADAGRQSLVTFTGGFELGRESHRGPFLASGLGVGHSTISDAKGPTDSPGFGLVPLHDRTAAAYALGLGYRFWSGRMAIALRTHGLFGEGLAVSAHTVALTLGIAHFIR